MLHLQLQSRCSLQRDDDMARMPTSPSTLIAMLIQIDALPSTQCQTSIPNWDGEAGTHQRRFHMPWHIIVTLHCVAEGAIPIPLGWNNLVQCNFHVSPNIRVGVLVDRQRSTGVLDEEVGKSNLDLR